MSMPICHLMNLRGSIWIDYDVNPGDEIWMYNYVKENGYNYAAVKCESNTGDDYSVGFLWSPDSV